MGVCRRREVKRLLQVRRCGVEGTWGNGRVQGWGMHGFGVQEEARCTRVL